jgi:hypothetical protein
MFVHLCAVCELGGNVKDCIKLIAGEYVMEEDGVSNVSFDAEEAGKCVFVGFKIEVDYGVAFTKESSFEDTSEEA